MKNNKTIKYILPLIAGICIFSSLTPKDSKIDEQKKVIQQEPDQSENGKTLTIHFGPGPSDEVTIHFGPGSSDEVAIHFGPGASSATAAHFGPGPGRGKTVALHFGPGPSGGARIIAENEPKQKQENFGNVTL